MSTIGQLTVVLGADARDFTTAIQNVKSTVKGLQPELESITSGPLARFKRAMTLQESRAGSEGLRVLRSDMTQLASEALGTSGAVGKIGESFLSLGIGGPWGLAALGGIAAVSLAMKLFGEDSAAAAERLRSAMTAAANALTLPKFGRVADDLAAVGRELSDVRDHAAGLQQLIAGLAGRTDDFAEGMRGSLQKQLDATTQKLTHLEQAQDRLIDQLDHRLTPAQETARAAFERGAKTIQQTSQAIAEQRVRLEALAEHWGPAHLAGALATVQGLYAGLSPTLAAATGQMASQLVVLEQLTKNYNALQLLKGLPTRPAAQLQFSGRAFSPVTAETSQGGQFDPGNVALGLIQSAEAAREPLALLQTEFSSNLVMLQRFRADLAKGLNPEQAIADLERIANEGNRIREVANAFLSMAEAIRSIAGPKVDKLLAPLYVASKIYAAFELAQGFASLAAALFGVGGPNPEGIAAAQKHFQAAAQFGSIGGGGGGSSGGGGGAGSISTGGSRLGVTAPTQESAGTLTVVFPGKKVFDPSDPDAQDAFATFISQVTQRNLVIRTDG
jgi:hypothetical protein